jgi:hypothetical protein
MTIMQAIQIYLLALLFIPVNVCAYALTHVIMAKDSDSEIRGAHRIMAFCVRHTRHYFTAVTCLMVLAMAVTP